jgi:LysR family transcriptional regulator, transcription activator of glutamate synthase operon
MDLARLRSLVVLSEEGHFTRAAERLHIAQPALSQQIRKLEEEAGLPLVDRTTRRVHITEAGQLLVDYARVMLSAADDATAALGELAGLEAGRLSIGATQTLGPLDLAGVLAGFHRRYPRVELTVHEDLSFQLAEALQRDVLDLAFLTLEQSRTPTLESHPVASDTLVCVLSPDHPLARRKTLPLAELRDERFAMFRGGATIRGVVEAAAREKGFELGIAFETNAVLKLKALVSAGLAVAVLPRSDAEGPGPSVASVPLSRPTLRHVVHVAWRKGRRQSPATRAFLELLRQAEAPSSMAAISEAAS